MDQKVDVLILLVFVIGTITNVCKQSQIVMTLQQTNAVLLHVNLIP